MYTAYNLKISEDFFNDILYDYYDFGEDMDRYIQIGKDHMLPRTTVYKKKFIELVRRKIINGREIQKECFPVIDADVFISHSHNDKDLANALAGWLHKKFDLKVFIDSNVWEYSDDLLTEINDKYSNKQYDTDGRVVYNYKSCNLASQHVNVMLLTALQKMIDKTECIIFLNTDNSVHIYEKSTMRLNQTYSPWIYSEILNTQLIRKKPLFYYRKYKNYKKSVASESVKFINALQIAYNVSLDHLIELDSKHLIEWYKKYFYENKKYEEYPLDALYSFTNQKDIDDAKIISNRATEEDLYILKSAVDGDPIAQIRLSESIYQVCCEASDLNCTVCQDRRCQFKNN